MPRTRQVKSKTQDDSKTSLDVASTSSQPSLRSSSRKKASPFCGFEVKIDETKLSIMKRVLKAESTGSGGGSCEEALQDIPVIKEKRKRSSSPKNYKTKQIKTAKILDSNHEKENSIDLFKKAQAKANFNKKKSQSRSNKKDPTVYMDEQDTEQDTISKDIDKEYSLNFRNKGGNFVNIFNNMQRGLLKPSVFDEIAEQVALKSLRWFHVFAKDETTDLRVTALAWHPTNGRLLVSGGKAGTLILYKIDEDNRFTSIVEPGTGPGGTMECIRFHSKSGGVEVCTASVDGSISLFNFDALIRKPLVISEDPYRVWFCAVDIHEDGKSVFGADCMGRLAIHHLDSGKTDYASSTPKFHGAKIRHLEFSPRDPNLMVTSSLDKTVKLWDIRKMDGKNSCIDRLEHTSGVSAAKFSRTDGCHLLTIDQHSELRVYKAPLWHLEHNITHPHRHFQHLTVIRASWHPRADIAVVGRYPDPKLESTLDDLRSVDIYSASSGKLCHELTDTSKLITSLVEFNSTGSFLASSSGRNLYLWKQRMKRN